MTRSTRLDVKSLSDVVAFVGTGFDESELLIVPPSSAAPEDKTEDGKNDHPKEYAHDNASYRTPWNTSARCWTAKRAVGKPETCQKKRECLHWNTRNGGDVDVPDGKEIILCIRDDQRVGSSRVKTGHVKQHGAFLPYRLCRILCRLSVERNIVITGNGISETKDGHGCSCSNDIN